MENNASTEKPHNDAQETRKVLRQMTIYSSSLIVLLLLGLWGVSRMMNSTQDSINSLPLNDSNKMTKDPSLLLPEIEWPEKPVLVSFWAAWCGPCVKELPDIQQFASQQSDIQVIMINIDEINSDHHTQAKNLLAPMGHLPFIHIFSTAGLLQKFGGESLPAHFLYSVDKKLVWESNGAIPWNNEKIKNQLFSIIELNPKKAREPEKN